MFFRRDVTVVYVYLFSWSIQHVGYIMATLKKYMSQAMKGVLPYFRLHFNVD